MTAMMQTKAGEVAEWLAELLRTDDEEVFTRLAVSLAAIGEARAEVCGKALEFGEGWEDWASQLYASPETPARPTPRLKEAKPEAKPAWLRRRKVVDEPKAKTKLSPEVEAVVAKLKEAEPTPLCEETQPEAAAQPEAEAEAEPRKAEPEEERPETDEAYVEDSEDAGNDIRRRLWRVNTALEYIPPSWAGWVRGVLWRLSKGDREKGREILVKWSIAKGRDEEGARKEWGEGDWCLVEDLFHYAAKAGWRYPLAQNLNKLDEMVERSEEALVRAEVDIYQSGKRLVRPVRSTVLAATPAGSTKVRTTTIATLEPINEPWLKSVLTRHVDYFKWGKDVKRAGMGVPGDLASSLLSRYGKWEFPKVSGIITAPTLRRDGSILAKEGWDADTGLLVMGPLPKMPKVAVEPDEDEVRRAIRLLDGLLGEFPFVDGASRSAAMSGLITPVVRGALTCAPGHAYTAPQAGTGKSLLVDLTGAIALGDAMPIIATGGDQHELEKRIDSQVFAGLSMWSFDNVSMPIGGDAICQAIERMNYGARVLSKSEVRSYRNTWSMFITGNNLRITGDANRRILQVSLDARCERPELRRFTGDPFAEVLANRGQYLWAALTVVRGYIKAGQPGRLPWVGQPFGEWSDLVRSALVWLGYEDPFKTTEATRKNDPSLQARMGMLQAIWLTYQGQSRTAAEMLADAEAGAIIPRGGKLIDAKISKEARNLKAAIAAYIGDDKKLSSKHLGNKFNTDRDVITDGLVLRSEYNSHHKVNFWFAEKL